MYRNEAQMVVELSGLSLIGHSVLTELNGFVIQHKLIELINSLVNVGHIKLLKLSRLIVHSDSEGAHTAFSCNETTFRAFELIVVSTSFANFQLIVDLLLIQNCEGACEVPITHYSASEGDQRSITFSLKQIHLQRLIVEFIKADMKNVQESRALSTSLPMLHNMNSKFIVASHYSKTFLHFSKGFAIFCEGDRENTNNGNGTEDNEVVALASAISTQAELDALASLDFSGISGLVNQICIISLIGVGDLSLNSLVGSSASFAH